MDADGVYNVIKFHLLEPTLSLLCYPDFFETPHPELQASITVKFASGKVRKYDYRESPNPPILHRKETLLPPYHPLAGEFRKLTAAEEAEGLYQNPRIIGFKLNWESLLADRGLAYSRHELIKIAAQAAAGEEKPVAVQRHKTAISRHKFSRPIQTILEYGLLKEGTTLLDYASGRRSEQPTGPGSCLSPASVRRRSLKLLN